MNIIRHGGDERPRPDASSSLSTRAWLNQPCAPNGVGERTTLTTASNSAARRTSVGAAAIGVARTMRSAPNLRSSSNAASSTRPSVTTSLTSVTAQRATSRGRPRRIVAARLRPTRAASAARRGCKRILPHAKWLPLPLEHWGIRARRRIARVRGRERGAWRREHARDNLPGHEANEGAHPFPLECKPSTRHLRDVAPDP